MKFMLKRLFKVLLIALIINMSLVNVFADQEYYGKTGSIQITLEKDSQVIDVTGVKFELYKIANLHRNNIEFVLLNQYKIFGLNVNFERDDTTADWQYEADLIKNEIIKSSIDPDYTESTVNGVVKFDDLEVGLYLVTGYPSYIEEDEEIYKYQPSTYLVSVPQYNEDYSFKYDVSVVNKYTREPINYDDPDTPFTKLTVIKKFADLGHELSRPQEVVIDLYKNSELFETITLNDDNNFQYTWNSLSKEFEWTVIEREVAKYRTSYEKPDKYNVVVTNTYITPNTPPNTPPDTPDTPEPPTSDVPPIPSTGVLWWPVPILLVAGAACLIIGYDGKKENKKNI